MIIEGDQFAAVYNRRFNETVRLLSTIGVRPDLAQEFAQGAWAQAWQSRSDLRNPDKLAQWVNSIAINLFRSSLRQRSRESGLDAEPWYESNVAPAHLVSELISAAGPDSPVLECFYIRGHSTAEIAVLYDTSPLAIRVRLWRARQRVRAALDGSRVRLSRDVQRCASAVRAEAASAR